MAGHLALAGDLWDRLALPFSGMRLRLRRTGAREVELGPTVAVIFAGRAEELSQDRVAYRAGLCFGHRAGTAGLFALGFDDSIDWEQGTVSGYVMDNRPGSAGEAVATRFPIPASIRLSFSIRSSAVERLKELTGNRAFNWVRGLDKHLFYTLLSADTDLQEYLPDTRLVQGPADLAAMLTRHDTVFVKNVVGSRGKALARVRRTDDGFELSHIERGNMVHSAAPDLDSLVIQLRKAVGSGRSIVQQGVNTVGNLGRAAHFRIVLVKDGQGQWQCPVTEALASPDQELVFTNHANGALEIPLVEYLNEHHGLHPLAAAECEEEMIQLCFKVANVLEPSLHPLGMLGVDLGRDVRSGKLWLFEANTVPGWGYPDEVEHRMAQSLTDYALYLAEWNRLPV